MQQQLKNLRKKQQATDNLKEKIGKHIAASNAGSEMAGKQIFRVGAVGLIGSLSAQLRRVSHNKHTGGFLWVADNKGFKLSYHHSLL